MNRNNLVNYLRAHDLWNNEIYDNEDFNNNLNELKQFNVQINQIITLYKFLGTDIEDNFCEDVKTQIENEESKNKKPVEKEKNVESGNDDNDDDNDDPFAAKNNEDDVYRDRH